jgi:precorrin-6A/cobalt-precorrin-6A reductase
MRVLILGGTTEASALARALAGDTRFDATFSLAGRTRTPAPQPLPTRIGGFGGADGIAQYVVERNIQAIVDATHPFAARITRNAAAAARAGGIKLLVLHRPPWRAGVGDRWHVVGNMQEAAEVLGATPRRVLLTIGRQDLAPFVQAPWHHYVIRSVDAPPCELLPPSAEVISARGPFIESEERALLSDRRIDTLVTKNSGGTATAAKLAAARELGLPVVMIARPASPEAQHVETVAAALAWLASRHAELRGV